MSYAFVFGVCVVSLLPGDALRSGGRQAMVVVLWHLKTFLTSLFLLGRYMTGHTTGGIWMCFFLAQVCTGWPGWAAAYCTWEGGRLGRCSACWQALAAYSKEVAHAPPQVPLIVAERVLLAALRGAGIMLPNPLRIAITLTCQNQVCSGGVWVSCSWWRQPALGVAAGYMSADAPCRCFPAMKPALLSACLSYAAPSLALPALAAGALVLLAAHQGARGRPGDWQHPAGAPRPHGTAGPEVALLSCTGSALLFSLGCWGEVK